MRAMRLFEQKDISQNPLELRDVPIPQPGPGQVRLRVQVCGACHTDLHTVEGDIHPPHLPVTPGHQVVGVIDALGEGASGRSLGQRVGVPWLYSADGACEYCRRGQENLCPQARFTGFDVDGGFAEYMLAQADYTLPLPDAVEDVQAAPLLCAGIIGYRSLRQAELQPGMRLGLFGFGASAHLSIQVARHWGCEVYVFTRTPAHRRHAEELGAAWTGGADDAPSQPLDCAVTFAPAGSLVPKALEKLRPGGTLAINAISMTPIPEMPYERIYGERTLRSVTNATYQDGEEFLALAAEIGIQSTVSLYDLEDANQALVELRQGKIRGAKVLRVTS